MAAPRRKRWAFPLAALAVGLAACAAWLAIAACFVPSPAPRPSPAVAATPLGRRSALLAAALGGSLLPLPLLAGGAARAEEASASADPLDRLVQQWIGELGPQFGLPANFTVGGEGALPMVDSGTGAILVGLAGFALVVFPILKFVLSGLIGLYLLRTADKGTAPGGRNRKPVKALKKLTERLSGRPPDPLEARQLKVTRLNDELTAMRANLAQRAGGPAAARLVRENSRRERRLATAWRGVAGERLGLTEKERTAVAKAFEKFAKLELARRDEVTEMRSNWIGRTLQRMPIGGYVDRFRLGFEMERQLGLQAALFNKLRDIPLSQEKLDKIQQLMADSEDPLWLPEHEAEDGQAHVYVLAFDGDGAATRAAQLQQEVSTILALPRRPREVVLMVRSTGGNVTGYGLAAAQLLRLRSNGIRLVVCVDEFAASGGYLMACCADHLICSPFAAIGSIGVISASPNAAARLEREGVRFIETTAGKWKRTVTPFREPTEEALAKAKADLEELYGQFQDFVKANRPAVDLSVVATGEVWFGPNALARGLVDELKTSSEYLLAAASEHGCEVLALNLEPPRRDSLASQLAGRSSDLVADGSDLADGAASVLRMLQAGLAGSASTAARAAATSGADAPWPAGTPQPRFEADIPLLRGQAY